MKTNYYALLMGFNEYKDKENLAALRFAEKDAADLRELLIDPELGDYSPKNIELVNDKSVTTDQIEQKLYQTVVNDRVPGDVVIVYFSGHGFIAGDNEEAFLATPDVTILDILKNPRKGLKMNFIHDEIFLASKASCVIFLLDCCHSGAFVPHLSKESKDHHGKISLSSSKGLIDDSFFMGEGRVAFVSSPKGVSSRESKDFKNGVFTYHLLNGLRGKAVESFTGDVTLNSLIPYVQALTPATQPPVRYGRDTGRIILSSPKNLGPLPMGFISKTDLGYSFHAGSSPKAIEIPLANPIKNEIIFVDKFLKHLKESEELNQPVNRRLLSAINLSLSADLSMIIRVNEKGDVFPKGFAGISQGEVGNEYINSLLANVSDIIHRDKKELLPTRFGISKSQGKTSGQVEKFILVLPLRLDLPREFLIVSSVPKDTLKFGEVIGHTLISAYKSTDDLSSIDLLRTEAEIIDNLRNHYGYLPYETFERRLSAFKEKLKTIEYYFEPIIDLGSQIEIDSWEALARDPVTEKAPVDLFKAAELWGTEFVKALDMHTLRRAITTYTKLWLKENGRKKMDPLSVNLYPETVFFDDYVSEIRKIIKDEGIIKSTKVVFEISEKRPLPKLSDKMRPDQDETDEFARRIKSISDDLNVGFAIDDFGVGHSSVSRLARLELTHVKIDREVLHHQHPETTIKYVLRLVHQPYAGHVKVIVEGFDGDSRISLYNLYKNLNIEFVQGHLVRRASPSLRFLSNAKVKYLQGLLADTGD